MPGLYNNGVPQSTLFTGAELWNLDNETSNGANPQSSSANSVQLANLTSYYGSKLDKTMVAGSRYYTTIPVGFPATITGIDIEVGGTGGTDLWIFELHGPTGLLLATTTTSGTTAGTANTWQRIAFTAAYTITVPGQYAVAIQSNGTTAKFASLNAPAITGTYTGSATGVFATGASITMPTTYTANLGPKALLY